MRGVQSRSRHVSKGRVSTVVELAEPHPVAGAHPAPVVPEFSIVPTMAIPAVAIAVAGLIWAIESNTLWGLTFFHVVGGGLWTGVDLFVGFVLGPIIGRMSIPARVEFSTRFMPKMLLLMPTLVTMTLASGFQLARHVGNLGADVPNHNWLVASYIVVGLMAVVAIGILEPANLTVLFELKKPRPDGQLIARQMQRFVYTAGITGAAQVATLVIMTYLATH
jgi:hypothetical protein